MKYFTYAFLFSFILSFSFKTESMAEGLKGNLEILFNSNIEVIDLATDKKEVVFVGKPSFQRIWAFDTSPVDDKRVISTSGNPSNSSQLVLYSPNNELRKIISYNFLGYPSFSSDGKLIAYLQRDYLVEKKNWIDDWLLNITDTGGFFNKKISNISLQHFKPSWFPGGKHIAVTSKDLGIYSVDTKTGSHKRIIDYGVAPSISNSGKFIAYLSKEIDSTTRKSIREYVNMSVGEYNGSSKDSVKKKELTEIENSFLRYAIYIYNVETGESRTVTKVLSIEKPVVWSPDDEYLLFNDERSLGHDIYSVKIGTGEIKKVTEHHGQIMAWRK